MPIMYHAIELISNFCGYAIIHENHKIGPLENFPLYGIYLVFTLSIQCTGSLIKEQHSWITN